MVFVKNNFISTSMYNNLPHISDVANVPKGDAKHLADLRALLAKHNLPRGVSIRLIHKHFDIYEGEIMAFREVTAKPFGNVLVMRPLESASKSQLRALNYFVDYEGHLQAYEYTDSDTLDLSDYPAFLEQFCVFVVRNGLQMKLGLKTKSGWDAPNWSEFEYPCQRSTMIIPKGMPTPEGHTGFTVSTEWGAATVDEEAQPDFGGPLVMECVAHCNGHCHSHCYSHDADVTGDQTWYLGGQKLETGTPVHSLVSAVVAVWG